MLLDLRLLLVHPVKAVEMFLLLHLLLLILVRRPLHLVVVEVFPPRPHRVVVVVRHLYLLVPILVRIVLVDLPRVPVEAVAVPPQSRQALARVPRDQEWDML